MKSAREKKDRHDDYRDEHSEVSPQRKQEREGERRRKRNQNRCCRTGIKSVRVREQVSIRREERRDAEAESE